MRRSMWLASVPLLWGAAAALGAPPTLPAADEAAAFKAAGYRLKGQQWRACVEDPSPAASHGVVEQVGDLNGDGWPEAVLSEGGTYCYGHTGAGYSLVSKQANGSWKLIAQGTGILTVLPTKGVGGWPDLEIGGPGFCFPVERWNGRHYALHRHQYDGKPCRK